MSVIRSRLWFLCAPAAFVCCFFGAGTAAQAAVVDGLAEHGGRFLEGTLTGRLLFGYPASGVAMTDIAVLALALFIVLKAASILFRRPKADDAGRGAPVVSGGKPDPWERMRERGAPGAGGMSAGGNSTAMPADKTAAMPAAEFDEAEFLRGAKRLFARLQESWDRRDVADIASFSTPAISNEVRAQAEADPNPSKTQLLLVDARLVSNGRDGDEDIAAVYFDVLLRENPKAETTTQVREIWHFVRPSGSNGAWKLDGIQPVE